MRVVHGFKGDVVRRWLALLALLALAGCAATAQRNRIDQFDRTARAYEKALSWSDFEGAAEISGVAVPDKKALERLRQVRVISYEQRAAEVSPDGTQARRSVQIEYTVEGSMKLRTLVDQQAWRFDQARERWLLVSGLPKFFERD